MEPRLESKVLIPKKKAQRAAKKAGMDPNLLCSRKNQRYVHPTKEEKAYCRKKNLTVFQGRLRSLYKVMLDNRLAEESLKVDLIGKGRTVVTSGLHFKELMLRNSAISEAVFSEWANRIGITHLYYMSHFGDQNEISTQNHSFLTCIDTFQNELVYNEKDESYEVVEPLEKPGMVVSVVTGRLVDCSGKNVYERFVDVLRTLR